MKVALVVGININPNTAQKTWIFIESLFIGSDEIKRELQKKYEEFQKIAQEIKDF